MPRMTRWRWWHAPLILLALDLIVFGDLLLSGGTRLPSEFRGDIGGQFLGWRAFGFGELAHGRLPLWNPHLFCGAPFLAGFQSALLYPPNWIYCLLPLGWAVNVDVALHVWLGGCSCTRGRRGASSTRSPACWPASCSCSAGRTTCTSRRATCPTCAP
jgi:hypothetical protein